jgi:hypothetical protein
MGFLDRMRNRAGDSRDDDRAEADPAGRAPGRRTEASRAAGAAGAAHDGVEPVDEVAIRPLTEEELAGVDEVRAAYGAHGIDPADLGSIATAYDRAVEHHDGTDASAVIDVVGTAIGDHLVATAGYRWVVARDPFGTDLAVEPPRKGVPVVTRMLVAVRWMAREQGWVTGVTEHLQRAGRR